MQGGVRLEEASNEDQRDFPNNDKPNVKKKNRWMETEGDGEVPHIYMREEDWGGWG